mgnify:CR=1 FL=1
MKSTYIFSGHAQLPEGTDLYENYKYMTVLMEVDIETGLVVNCVVPVYCKLHNDFVADMMQNRCLDDGLEPIIAEVEARVHTLSKRAFIAALQVIYNRYTMLKRQLVVQNSQKNLDQVLLARYTKNRGINGNRDSAV